MNISNSSSGTNQELLSNWTRTGYNCQNTSHSNVMYQSRKNNEQSINVHIVKRNWNISDCVGNFTSRKDTNYFLGNICDTRNTTKEQEAILHSNNKYLSQVVSLPGSHSWKSYPYLQTGQMNCNQVLAGNPSTPQKQNVLQVLPHQEKAKSNQSENAKIIYNHSLLINSGTASTSTLSHNVGCYSLDSEDLFTDDNTMKESKENYGNHAATSDMTQYCSVPVWGDQGKAILKTLSMFSVVQKKLKWSCSCCGESVATRLSLTTHIKSHLLPWCRLCLKVVNSNEQLQSHKEKKHPSSDIEIDQPETQFVTSKYGRRRRVYSPATLLPKRRFDIKK